MGLFNDFDEVSHQQWTDKIIKDLKGKDFDEHLVWKSIEGIPVQPFYNNESLESNLSKNFSLENNNNSWEISTQVSTTNIQEANKKALYLLSRGSNSVQFNNEITTQADFNQLLNDVDISIIHVHFYNSSPTQTLDFLTQFCSSKAIELNSLNCSITYDYLGELITQGSWKTNQNSDLKELVTLCTNNNSIKTIAINGDNFNNAGASIVQELAYSFSQAVEYLNYLTEQGLDINLIANKVVFNFGISSNYFFEIAKIRAAKIIWKLLLNEYNTKTSDIYINSTTSLTNYATFDAHNNILRATTEAMSAIIGGSNSITILPFNQSFETTSEFSERIAINIQHVLKEESYLHKVNDSSKGSFYIENLTDELVEKSLAVFKEIEQKGGFLANVTNGFIQDSIHSVAQQKQEEYSTGKRTLLGVNKHKNANQKQTARIETKNTTKTSIISVLKPIVFADKIERSFVIEQVN